MDCTLTHDECLRPVSEMRSISSSVRRASLFSFRELLLLLAPIRQSASRSVNNVNLASKICRGYVPASPSSSLVGLFKSLADFFFFTSLAVCSWSGQLVGAEVQSVTVTQIELVRSTEQLGLAYQSARSIASASRRSSMMFVLLKILNSNFGGL